MQSSIQKLLITVVLLVAVCLFLVFKKSDDNSSPVQPQSLIRMVIAPSPTNTGVYDTAFITYNADNTVHQIVNSLTSSFDGAAISVQDNMTTTFYYGSNFIKKVYTYPSTPKTWIDSIVLGDNGLPAARYAFWSGLPYNASGYYTYNGAGELVKTILTYSKASDVPPDTIMHTWANGDLVSEVCTCGDHNRSYSYNLEKPCIPGDIQYLRHLTETGQTTKPNRHLCIGVDCLDPATFTYSYDTMQRIKNYAKGDGRGYKTVYFTY